ncbi:DoxX family protein [Nesterenkonia muleiensis]|uniref:DoxX family protein n=1 Tax=Nesterenkonia muleiensis TaxID=2282648 RepID=UPI001EE41000|nr:DoxX family protein [Nesterenkonia muleiensis]
MNTKTRITLLNAGLLMARVTVGLIFIVHGWQKLTVFGHEGVTGMLQGFGVPFAPLAAVLLIALEFVGGILFGVGALTRVIGVLFMVSMTVALFTAHAAHGFFPDNGGYAYVLLLGVMGLAFALTGPGDFSIDRLAAQRVSRRETEKLSA